MTLTQPFLQSFARRPLLVGLLAGASALIGCSPARLLDALTPAGEYSKEADVPYGADPRQRLDVYLPPGSPKAVIVFFYGGAWRAGRKADYRFVAETLTGQGMAVVIPDYRIFPQVRFPAFVEDGAAAVRWTRERFGPQAKLTVMGHSSGAHIAALLALDGRYLRAVGLTPGDLAGVVGIAGPYDFLPFQSRRTAEIFDGTPDLATTQPVSYANREAPPFLLLHGTHDTTVLPRNSRTLADRLREQGASVQTKEYPRTGHAEIMLGLSSVLAGESRMMADIAAFLDRPLAP